MATPDREREIKSALEAAGELPEDDGFVSRLVEMLLDFGLDGRGPLDSAQEVADSLLEQRGSAEEAVKAARRRAFVGGVTGGFITGVGGFVTLPVALPVNVVEFYVQATRLVGVIAHLRGYDVDDARIRTAVLLTLVGARSEDVLAKAGLSTATGRVTSFALRGLPPGALMMINKAIGFRLVRVLGERSLASFGRGVPLVGGAIGGGLDGWMMKQIAEHADQEFPRQ